MDGRPPLLAYTHTGTHMVGEKPRGLGTGGASRVAMLLAIAALAACSKSTPEPEPSAERRPAHTAAALTWHAPASWTLEKSAPTGAYRAKYTIPAQGGAPHPAELLISTIGSDAADADRSLAELKADFEGPGSEHPETRTVQKNGFERRELEIAGTYKFAMGPKVGKKQRAAAQMLKEHWRAAAAAVKTPAGEWWFFRLVGPDDSVQAARSAFFAMLDGLEP
jgi:hypothetical protein